ncbi:ZIP family metal transporter [Leptothoe spongobia]|uniref:ZIP family metal transporter n=1 Tax=Leptothoe spongobia TAU-MAC 1115 TaxID=1967444 RepID=A0A947DJ80_9CYAN|nr:ZIP family metal transporter [Leptothoe spongobia]MBT9317658.1 ZIP family metal transporter [Leptothoe spongobia TAU-MAC 1115]
MEQLSQSWSSVASDVMSDGVMSSLLASFGTGVGAVPVLFTSQLSERWQTLLLSVGSGVMLSAAAFSLLVPALGLAGQAVGYGVGTGEVISAVILGAAMFYALERLLPEPELNQQAQSRHIWLFVLAIALHHFPEGLAVGLGTESTHDVSIAIGVGLQNLPEGLMVALALRQLGYGVGLAMALAAMSGWLEPLGGLLGVTLVDLSSEIAPVGMALAAGAMLFVVLHELLPKLNLKTLNSSGAVGLMTGVVVMGMVEQFLG